MTKVLVVDDVSTNVTVLTWMLVHQGYTVTPAVTGQQALDIVAVERPDVILLDVSMPDMSGIEVCRQLKSDPELRLIPIILVTARTRNEDVVEGLNAGADDYITKPVTREVLSARLRSAAASQRRLFQRRYISRPRVHSSVIIAIHKPLRPRPSLMPSSHESGTHTHHIERNAIWIGNSTSPVARSE